MSVKERITAFALSKEKSIRQFEERIGVSNGYIKNIVNSISISKLDQIAKVYPDLNKKWILLGDEGEKILNNSKGDKDHRLDSTKNSTNNTFANSVENYVYESLPYISMKARASFVELGQIQRETGELFRVIKTDPNESFANQIVIEIDGDSMEPVLFSGSKVRCKEIDRSDWVYLNSGVYAITYGNFFVVKRIKSSPTDGILTLHSDNGETGGSLNVPLNEVRNIWKVLRIVDAPIR